MSKREKPSIRRVPPIAMNLYRLMDRENRMKQAELSRQSGVSQAMISRMISGEQENPGLEKLRALAKALNAKLSDLVEDAPIENRLPDFPYYVQRKFGADRLMREVLSNVYETIKAWEATQPIDLDNPITAEAASSVDRQNVPPQDESDDDFPG